MTEEISRVYPAEPYRGGQLGSFGRASCMLLCQFDFPDTFSEKDVLEIADHDRCFRWDYDHANRAFRKHVGRHDSEIEQWARKATSEQVFAFLIDILKQQEAKTRWTGYRILGTVGGNGHAVFSLALFAKHPKSETKVYTGENAPNVLLRPRCAK